MGFCRRCGDIVPGARCHCGGTAVAPVIAWKPTTKPIQHQDVWSKTYEAQKRSASPVRPTSISKPVQPTGKVSPPNTITGRFPRPKSTSSFPSPPLRVGVSDHIMAATSQSPCPPSPLKFSTTLSDVDSDILPSFLPHEPSLSKVYGSVLQPKDTLTLHSCAICSIVFPPDATIYPNPTDLPSAAKSFLCRPCFTTNGGSKGNCPACSRPVLALKVEGGFIYAGDNYWHKRCFSCTGCFKNVGNAPMVDLLGRPTCVECFDSCLKRDPSTPKKGKTSNNNSPSISNPGGLNISYGRKSRESSPAIEELEFRLGISKSRENSPAPPDSARPIKSSPSRRFSTHVESPTNRRYGNMNDISPTKSPSSRCLMPVSPIQKPTSSSTPVPDYPLQRSLSYASLSQSPSEGKSIRAPPQLDPWDVPTNATFDIHSSTAPFRDSSPSANFTRSGNSQSSPLITSTSSPVNVSTSSLCDKCHSLILNSRQGGQFVTIPSTDENTVPRLYHTDCFRCHACDRPFGDSKKGQASFVHTPSGPCHMQCAPVERFVVRKAPIIKPLQISALDILDPPVRPIPLTKNSSMPPPSSRFERPLAPPHIPSKSTMPRFGGQAFCPGCQKSVSPMERGVVPGPQGTRWHASCLVCGGKKEMTPARLLGRIREEKKKGEPGCGKKLDSAAKSDGEGGIWCRECLLLLGVGGSPQASPTRSPLVPSFTGGSNKITPQYTGTTTIARQFTGAGSSEALLRQLTGGGLSPTRSISPTKQLGMVGGVLRPRPKSVIGMRSAKSVDEGRGMFLVRQLTGATAND